jgi:phage-related baseplate assembly protein
MKSNMIDNMDVPYRFAAKPVKSRMLVSSVASPQATSVIRSLIVKELKGQNRRALRLAVNRAKSHLRSQL